MLIENIFLFVCFISTFNKHKAVLYNKQGDNTLSSSIIFIHFVWKDDRRWYHLHHLHTRWYHLHHLHIKFYHLLSSSYKMISSSIIFIIFQTNFCPYKKIYLFVISLLLIKMIWNLICKCPKTKEIKQTKCLKKFYFKKSVKN